MSKTDKTIKIDQDKCLGCGTCVALAPEFFTLDPKTGKAKIKKQPQTAKDLEKVKLAIASCPVSGISFQKK